jgi:hypothetical protein
LYDADRGRKWEIPAYPARVHNPTGAGDAFCGGFLAGYQRTYDPLEAVLYGNVSFSLVAEGEGPFYALDALPGLPQARLEYLRGSVREVKFVDSRKMGVSRSKSVTCSGAGCRETRLHPSTRPAFRLPRP